MCDFFEEIICSHSLWDWWSDIIIPTAGAVAIPVMIWYFSSVRAEEQKELRQLNLLLSLCLDSIFKLISLRSTLCQIREIEKKDIDKIYEEDIQKITKVYISPIDFSTINVADYSSCIAYSENYVIDLIKILSAMKIKDFKIEHHNFQIKSIAECSDKSQKILKLKELISIERKEFPQFTKEVEEAILFIRNFIKQTKDLEKKIKGLKLDNITYSEEQLALFIELEKAQTKENNND